jgi:hypothetical protein
MTGWATEELQYAQLGDVRRNKRLIRLVSDLAAQPNVSVALFIRRLGSYPSRL